jgi:hypothetical protein
MQVLPADRLDDLVAALRAGGYRVVGPVLREGAVSYGEITSATELPRGWTDRQEAGTYRLERDPRDLYFGFTLGAQSWKPYLFPPRLRLWTAVRGEDGFEVREDARRAGSAVEHPSETIESSSRRSELSRHPIRSDANDDQVCRPAGFGDGKRSVRCGRDPDVRAGQHALGAQPAGDRGREPPAARRVGGSGAAAGACHAEDGHLGVQRPSHRHAELQRWL